MHKRRSGRPGPPREPRPCGPLRVLMVAGESSADRYGARVLDALRESQPQVETFGVGGEGMARAGLAREGAASEIEVVGFTGVLLRLPRLIRLYRRLLRLLEERRPDGRLRRVQGGEGPAFLDDHDVRTLFIAFWQKFAFWRNFTFLAKVCIFALFWWIWHISISGRSAGYSMKVEVFF